MKEVNTMAQISLRVDDDVKRGAEQILTDIGLSMSTAINVFLRKVAREGKIPFELTADPFFTESNMRYLESIMQDVKEGKANFAEHDLIEVD
jgi:DNA-damage-inducible protein J